MTLVNEQKSLILNNDELRDNWVYYIHDTFNGSRLDEVHGYNNITPASDIFKSEVTHDLSKNEKQQIQIYLKTPYNQYKFISMLFQNDERYKFKIEYRVFHFYCVIKHTYICY